MPWLRVALLLAFVALGAAAVTETSNSTPLAAPAVEPSSVAARATPVPLPTALPQMIISRVARETATPAPSPTPPAQPQVAVVDNGFIPVQLEVTLGSDVLWINSGGDGHDVTGTGPGGPWRSGPLAPRDRYERPFALPGTYDYVCSVHPEMRGRIVVR